MIDGDVDDVIAQEEGTADDWLEMPAPQNLPLIFNMLGFMLRKWGGDYIFSQPDITSMKGATIHLRFNPKTTQCKLFLVEPGEDIWKLATPGIAPGHA